MSRCRVIEYESRQSGVRIAKRYLYCETNLFRTTMKNYRPVDLKAIAGNAMRKYGFEPQFPASVVQEVNAINIRSLPKSQKDTKDLRMLLWSSTAKPPKTGRYR
jgi:hypothetical protein